MIRAGDGALAQRNDLQGIIIRAQEIWSTFNATMKRSERRSRKQKDKDSEDKKDGDRSRQKRDKGGYQGRGGQRGGRGGGRGGSRGGESRKPGSTRLSSKESERRQKEGLCFNCGKPNHIKQECRSSFNPEPVKPREKNETRDEYRKDRLKDKDDQKKARSNPNKRKRSEDYSDSERSEKRSEND